MFYFHSVVMIGIVIISAKHHFILYRDLYLYNYNNNLYIIIVILGNFCKYNYIL